ALSLSFLSHDSCVFQDPREEDGILRIPLTFFGWFPQLTSDLMLGETARYISWAPPTQVPFYYHHHHHHHHNYYSTTTTIPTITTMPSNPHHHDHLTYYSTTTTTSTIILLGYRRCRINTAQFVCHAIYGRVICQVATNPSFEKQATQSPPKDTML
ncbi:unnamed protein product, partial [Nesidiocoris tenuis]